MSETREPVHLEGDALSEGGRDGERGTLREVDGFLARINEIAQEEFDPHAGEFNGMYGPIAMAAQAARRRIAARLRAMEAPHA